MSLEGAQILAKETSVEQPARRAKKLSFSERQHAAGFGALAAPAALVTQERLWHTCFEAHVWDAQLGACLTQLIGGLCSLRGCVFFVACSYLGRCVLDLLVCLSVVWVFFVISWLQTRMTAIFNPFSEAGWCPWVPRAQASVWLGHCFRFGSCGCALRNASFCDTFGITMPVPRRQLGRAEPAAVFAVLLGT